MANEQRPIVNQRLYFCRLHLEYLFAELEKQRTAKVIVEQSLGESIVLHLVLTYRAYLLEIAAAYTVPLSTFCSASELMAALSHHNHPSAEAQELLALEQDGWLHELLLRYRELGGARNLPRANRSPAQNLVVTHVDSHQVLDAEQCRFYLQSLSELIENQRTRLEEW